MARTLGQGFCIGSLTLQIKLLDNSHHTTFQLHCIIPTPTRSPLCMFCYSCAYIDLSDSLVCTFFIVLSFLHCEILQYTVCKTLDHIYWFSSHDHLCVDCPIPPTSEKHLISSPVEFNQSQIFCVRASYPPLSPCDGIQVFPHSVVVIGHIADTDLLVILSPIRRDGFLSSHVIPTASTTANLCLDLKVSWVLGFSVPPHYSQLLLSFYWLLLPKSPLSDTPSIHLCYALPCLHRPNTIKKRFRGLPWFSLKLQFHLNTVSHPVVAHHLSSAVSLSCCSGHIKHVTIYFNPCDLCLLDCVAC